MPPPTSTPEYDLEHNLLFAVLALRIDAITDSQFVEACNTWTRRKEVPLPELLAARGWISPADRAEVERLVERKLKKYGGDARNSLAELSGEAINRAMTAVQDPNLRQSLTGAYPERDIFLPPAPYLAPSRDRYTLTRLHAHGGLGQVWIARDAALGRNVALKELRPPQAGNPAVWSRFVEEAQITGQLEHPGIVPVYELSRGSEEQPPFYTMRFVRGRTLTEAIQAYHDKCRAGKVEPLEQRALLRAFVGVCHTVAYAHARGVIHRDLKGQNVVLGDYGEVIVLDWGLAKLTTEKAKDKERAKDKGQGAKASEEVEEGKRAETGECRADDSLDAVALDEDLRREATVQGQVMGTPAYMAPEQAAGQSDQIAPHTDIHGLGAMLYEILTSQPPFQGNDTQAVLRQARDCDPPRPSRLAAGVPLALEAVCLKAMAKAPEDRYGSASEVAQEVERWLADEPVAAFPEPWTVRSSRWVRRHRTGVTTAVAAVGVASVCLAGLSALLAAANEREHQAKLLAEHNEQIAAVQRDEAAHQRDRARAHFQMARAALEKYEGVGEVPELKTHGLERLRTRLQEAALEFYQQFVQAEGGDLDVQADHGRAYWRLANLYQATGRTSDAESAYHTALEIQKRLIAASPATAELQRDLAATASNLGSLYHVTGRNDQAELAYADALARRQSLTTANPENQEYLKDLAISYSNLGTLYRATGRPGLSEGAYRSALDIRKHLAERNPNDPQLQQHVAASYETLGSLYYSLGRHREAEPLLKEAMAIQDRLVRTHADETDFQQDLASTHNNLGNLYSDTGRFREAEAPYRAALATLKRLAETHPLVPEYQQRLAGGYNNLGLLYRDLHQVDRAEASMREALAIREKLADAHPELVVYSVDASSTYINLGHLLRDTGRAAGALEWYARAIQKLDEALARDPRETTARLFLRSAHWGRAAALGKLGRYSQAIGDWDRAIELDNGQLRSTLRLLRADALAHGGDHVRATAEANELAAEPGTGGNALYNMACVCALSASAAARDPKLAAGERAKCAEACASRAVALLTRAFAGGFLQKKTEVDHMKKDTDLEALRQRPDYQKLLAEIEAKLTPASAKP
jgi:serine/threonine-protein kinase